MYVDYKFYKNTWGGNKVTEAEFTNLAVQATILIDYYTFDRIEEPDDKIKFAVCELVDYVKKLEDTGGKEVSSESVAGHSMSYVSEENLSSKQKQKEIVTKYLGHSGLMYRGG